MGVSEPATFNKLMTNKSVGGRGWVWVEVGYNREKRRKSEWRTGGDLRKGINCESRPQ